MRHFIENRLSIIAVTAFLFNGYAGAQAYSVREFLHDPELLKNTLAFCNTNLGEHMMLPNCVNSNHAAAKKNSMTEFSECFRDRNRRDIIDHACIDAYLENEKFKERK